MQHSDSRVIIEKDEILIVSGGTSVHKEDLDIPENIISKMRNLVKSLPENRIDMHEPIMGDEDCVGCSGGCTGSMGDDF